MLVRHRISAQITRMMIAMSRAISITYGDGVRVCAFCGFGVNQNEGHGPRQWRDWDDLVGVRNRAVGYGRAGLKFFFAGFVLFCVVPLAPNCWLLLRIPHEDHEVDVARFREYEVCPVVRVPFLRHRLRGTQL